MTARTAAAAEPVAQAVVDAGEPAAVPVIGPLRLVEIGYPAGTAVATGVSAGTITAVAAPVVVVLAVLLAIVVRWVAHRRRRSPCQNT